MSSTNGSTTICSTPLRRANRSRRWRWVEASDPRARIRFVPLSFEPGHAASFGVEGKIDPATGWPYELGYNQVFVDPVSGEILGKREWGAVSLSKENLLPFLYKLHYSLHVPAMWGIDRWGIWLMGIVAMTWLIDNFVAFYLTFPAGRRRQAKRAADTNRPGWFERWKTSWRVRWGGGNYKLNFDLHRAGGLWVWFVLFILAFTSFSLNLYREVFYPMMSVVSEVTPGPFETRQMQPLNKPVPAELDWSHVIGIAAAEGQRRNWDEPVGSVFYTSMFGFYGVSFFHPGEDHGSGGMGTKTLYFDGKDGSLVGDRVPWQGTAADVFVQLQFPLHSGRILGVPGRILMSIMGLVVAMLSVTGVYIWLKKRRARRLAESRRLLEVAVEPRLQTGE
jgi:uncharacterized iron-regulated membrane protein